MDSSQQCKLRKLEQYHYELHNELVLKREQVNQLRKELDYTELKNYKLTRELETYKSNLKETQANLNILMKNHQTGETEVNQLKQELASVKLKSEVLHWENDALNKYILQLTQDKNQLNNKIEDLESRCKYFEKLQNDYDKKHSKLKEAFQETRIVIEKFEKEIKKLSEMVNEVLKLQSVLDTQCLAENENLKIQYKEMEKKFINISAKCQKYEDLNEDFNENFWNIAFSQWKSIREQLNKQIKNDQDLIKRLTDGLNNESICNAKLILQCEANEEQLKELQDKLKGLE